MSGYIADTERVDQLKREIFDRANEIDPDDEEDWFSMTLGWAIAKGMNPDEAKNFSLYIRTRKDLG